MLDTYYALKRLMWQDNPFKLMIQNVGLTVLAMLQLPQSSREVKAMMTLQYCVLKRRETEQAALIDPKAPQHLHIEA